MLTPERIREALVASQGSRKDAAVMLRVSTDNLRIWIRRFRDQGYKFPAPQNERIRQAKCAENLQPGQWVEAGRDQECGEILAIEGERSLVVFSNGSRDWLPVRLLAWVPSGDVIADATRQMRANWPPGEHAKRARWAYCGEYEIPQVVLEDDSRSDTW